MGKAAKVGNYVDVKTTYTSPSMFVAGGRTDYLARAHEPVIRRYFPRAEFDTIKEAGHWLHAVEPATVLNVSRQLLDRKLTLTLLGNVNLTTTGIYSCKLRERSAELCRTVPL